MTLNSKRNSWRSVFTPFRAGCSVIVQYPYLEIKKDNPKSVIEIFDISSRPHIPEDVLSFATPMKKFETIINDIESFLIKESWRKVKSRIGKDQKEL